ncbi:MAG: sigma-54 dependent transcriptional regulator [Candidatus Sumerlaeota bacterium]|nr:sigma-54 dependent transcriptional regulator [Candidatus Sumerlaeota bacterium]
MFAAEEKEPILIADDDPGVRELFAAILDSHEYAIDKAHDGVQAIEMLSKNGYSVCFVDIRMPKADGFAVLRHIQDHRLDTVVIVATGYGTMENAVEAIRCGASDFLTKPFHAEEIRSATRRAIEIFHLRNQASRAPRRRPSPNEPIPGMIGSSPGIVEVQDLIRAVADSDSTAMILGKSGTGKELVARAIHLLGPRASRPMIPVNCGALPETLLESELFGHVKGAFTGAISDRAGRFQLANGGTLFLDEVGEMSPLLQVKLLRVLQEGQLEMVGSTKTINVDVRVIAATNRNLEEMVAQKTFREDLYYRLNVIPIHVPSLSERLDDLPRLIEHFIHKFNASKNRAFEGFEDDALEALRRHAWPGNVRELENLVERMVILHPKGKVSAAMLPEKYRSPLLAGGGKGLGMPPLCVPEGGVDMNALVEEYEAQMIALALEAAKGVKNRAAQLLNIKRTTLVEKMKKKGMLL